MFFNRVKILNIKKVAVADNYRTYFKLYLKAPNTNIYGNDVIFGKLTILMRTSILNPRVKEF